MSTEHIFQIISLVFSYLGLGIICSLVEVRFKGFLDRDNLKRIIVFNMLFWPVIVFIFWPLFLYSEYADLIIEKIVSFYEGIAKKD